MLLRVLWSPRDVDPPWSHRLCPYPSPGADMVEARQCPSHRAAGEREGRRSSGSRPGIWGSLMQQHPQALTTGPRINAAQGEGLSCPNHHPWEYTIPCPAPPWGTCDLEDLRVDLGSLRCVQLLLKAPGLVLHPYKLHLGLLQMLPLHLGLPEPREWGCQLQGQGLAP